MLAHLLRGHVLDQMLVRDHDLAHADRLAVFVLHGDLALGVRAQHLLRAGMAGFRDQPQDLVGVEDRRRHQIRRLVGGVAEHDALVARALFLVGAGLQRIDALRDVGGLRMQQDLDVAGVPVKAFLLVADVLDGVANDAFDLVVGDRFRDRGSRRRSPPCWWWRAFRRPRGSPTDRYRPSGLRGKTDRRSRRKSGRRPCPDDPRKPTLLVNR